MNYEITYRKMREWIKGSNIRYGIFLLLYNLLPLIVFISYGTSLVWAILTDWALLLWLLPGPATAFLIVTVFRKIWNAPRPYTIYDYEPLITKNKTGESFPSRHVASATAIAAPYIVINIYAFAGLITVAALIAVGRVIAGVHFIKDVCAGFVAGLIISGAVTLLINLILA